MNRLCRFCHCRQRYIRSLQRIHASRFVSNRLNIRRDALEASVLSGLRAHLMEPELFNKFCDEFTREVNRLRIERSADVISQRKELERVQRDLDRAIQAILDGVLGAQLKDKIGGLEARKAELTELLANAEEPQPLLHPNMAETYRQRIAALYESLQSEDGKAEAAELFRTLVDQVTLVPDQAELAIVLRGDQGAILRFAANKKNPDAFRKPRLWVPCFRKNRWLREGATPDYCDW